MHAGQPGGGPDDYPNVKVVLALTLLLSPLAPGTALAESLRLQGLSGATTANANTPEAMRHAVAEPA